MGPYDQFTMWLSRPETSSGNKPIAKKRMIEPVLKIQMTRDTAAATLVEQAREAN